MHKTITYSKHSIRKYTMSINIFNVLIKHIIIYIQQAGILIKYIHIDVLVYENGSRKHEKKVFTISHYIVNPYFRHIKYNDFKNFMF